MQSLIFKISIHARIWKDSGLDWYFEILSYFRGSNREIKSVEVIEAFSNFRRYSKRVIWNGLSKVPIHIVDPLPYQIEMRDMMRQRLKGYTDDIESFARMRARNGDLNARKLVNVIDSVIVANLIDDSPGERLKRLAHISINYPFGRITGNDALSQFRKPETSLMLPSVTPFERQQGGYDVKTATILGSKSASAFAHIYDYLDSPDASLAPSLLKFQLWYKLAQVHAFDKGNDVIFRLIQQKRSEIAEMLQPEYPFPFMRRPLSPLEQYGSEDSFYGQAADIAAGFARVEFEKGGIRRVMTRFEYVLYNGKRASEPLLRNHEDLLS
jgi:hypothetical protein